MTDETTIPPAPYPPQPAPAAPPLVNPVSPLPIQAGPSLPELAASLRRHRIWLIILSVLVTLPLLFGCFSAFAFTSAWSFLDSGMSIDDEQVARARKDMEAAYGDRIKKLDVRVVTMTYGDMPSFLSGGMNEERIYVECELKEPRVMVADAISPYFGGGDLSGTGIIPTRGSLSSRMSEEQLDGILVAYVAETDAPLGSVVRYTDVNDFEESVRRDEVRIDKKTYSSHELWKVTEGLIVRGDTVDGDSDGFYSRTGHVFHEDPETGEFVYLGTESSEMW